MPTQWGLHWQAAVFLAELQQLFLLQACVNILDIQVELLPSFYLFADQLFELFQFLLFAVSERRGHDLNILWYGCGPCLLSR